MPLTADQPRPGSGPGPGPDQVQAGVPPFGMYNLSGSFRTMDSGFLIQREALA